MSKIVLIEDDPTMISLLTTLLGIEGFDVVPYKGGTDVIDLLAQEAPEEVLLDVNLKNLGNNLGNGLDLLRAIRRHPDLQKIRVIMSSGMDFREESQNAGADGFIMKPYMPDDLIKLLKGNN